MIRSLYTAGTGMLVERSRMDTIGNNLVNVETQGYRQDTLISRSFRDMLLSRLNDPSLSGAGVEVGPLNTGVYADEVITSFRQGTPEQTDILTDMCIMGPAFFAVETPEGVRYTRAGNFTLSAQGDLLDVYGNYVLDESDAHIQLASDRFRVLETGEIIDTDTNASVATIKMVEFGDTGALRKTGENMFMDEGGANPGEPQNSTMLQGYVESSNVSIAQEMVNMIISSRAYEANQRAVRMIDETLQRTVNDIAKF